MDSTYLRQAELVVRCIPAIAAEPSFAIKGGTAINLFQLNLPRLSVDIDLTFLPVTDRSTAIAGINAALQRIEKRLEARGIAVRTRGTDVSRKIACFANGAEIKIEPNFILRGTAYPVRKLELSSKMSEIVGVSAEMQVLSFKELYGGKVCAALDRQHPRDLFDMAQFYKSHSLEEVKEGFLVLALGHNRPLHELLGPMIQEQSEIFDQQFAGMSDEPFSYDEHLATLERLTADVKGLFDDGDKQRLLDFVSLAGEENAWGIPHFNELPAIRWKRRNLESLRKSNPKKFTAQREALERLFEKGMVK
jgi:hypothetical protein